MARSGVNVETELPAGHLRLPEQIRLIASYRESGVLLAFLVIFGVMMIVSPTFRQPYNLETIFLQMSVVAIMAMGQTLVIISGAFDLSQGPVAGLVAMMTGLAWSSHGAPVWLAILAGLAVGLGCGIANGILAARFKLHPIVMTLATSTIFTGLIYFFTQGIPVIGLPNGLLELGAGNVRGVPTPVIVMVLVTLVMHIMLTRTLFGLRVRQMGGNLEAARLTGVNIQRTWVGVFAISGLLAALGGLVELGRVGNAIPSIGQTLLFPIISSAIIGGTLLSGGAGSMIGTLIGAATLTVINNALVVLQVNIYLQSVVQGALVVAALVLDQFRRGQLSWRDLIRRDI
jgi:ribose/xylose/arabinose/galactoside ABC-type transport system permease subunit